MENKCTKALLFILVLLTFSCKQQKSLNPEQIILNEKWYGKTIILPKSLEKIEREDYGNNEKNSKYTIVVYYDGNCNKCYHELAKWPIMINEFRNKNLNVNMKYVLSAYNKPLLKSYLEQANFPLKDIYYDRYDSLQIKYNFLIDPNYVNSALLVDENDIIKYIGNPTISESVKEKYFELIKTR